MGLQKTGTTTIQNVFHAHRHHLLSDHKVLYPSINPNLTTPLCTMFHDDPRLQHIMVKLMGPLSDDQLANLRNSHAGSLEQEIGSTEWDTLLFSAEGTCKLNDAELGRLKEWGDRYSTAWTVIMCVRHPVDYVRSIIQQLLKGGDTLDFLYENLPLPDFQTRIARAQNIFGNENVLVFDFDQAARSELGLVGTFANLCGIDKDMAKTLSFSAQHDNESLSSEAVHVLDALNKLHPLLINGVRNPSRPDRALAFVSRINGQKFELPRDVRAKVRDRVRDDVLWLNNLLGMNLYQDVFSPDYSPHGPLDRYNSASLSAFASMAELIGEISLKP